MSTEGRIVALEEGLVETQNLKPIYLQSRTVCQHGPVVGIIRVPAECPRGA